MSNYSFQSNGVRTFTTVVTKPFKYVRPFVSMCCGHVRPCADLCVTLHLWLASLYGHYLNSRVML